LGIISIQPHIAAWWSPRWWILKQGWSIISVSLAAQIATFPISAYYFHQFPNYFLITNLSALPLSSFVIYLGLAVIGTSFYPDLSMLLGKLLSWLVVALNKIVEFIEGLPGAVTHGLYLNLFETLVIYLFILLMMGFLLLRSKKALLAAMLAAVLFMSSLLYREWRSEHQTWWTVYSVKKASAMDFIVGRDRYLVADASLLCDAQRIDFHTGSFMDALGIRSFNALDIKSDTLLHEPCLRRVGELFFFKGKRIGIFSEKHIHSKPLTLDYLVIAGNPKCKMKDILREYLPRMIIIDASNSRYKAEKWVQQCSVLGIPCWSVPHSGAYVVEL
jgi:competence protein ComEC